MVQEASERIPGECHAEPQISNHLQMRKTGRMLGQDAERQKMPSLGGQRIARVMDRGDFRVRAGKPTAAL